MNITEIKKYGKAAKGRAELIRHLEGKALKAEAAIKAKCYDCVCYYADGLVSCELKECPLFAFMPYKEVKPSEG